MRGRPAGLDDAAVLQLVREHWQPDATSATHLPVGFGAHHWRVDLGYRPLLFVTYDELEGPGSPGHHTARSLEQVLAAVADLAFALDSVVASLPSTGLRHTVPVHRGVLSVTPWVQGVRAEPGDADDTAALVARLHRARIPRGLPRWESVVPPGLADDVTRLVGRPWHGGPLGERARAAVVERLDVVAPWCEEHARLSALAHDREQRWVATHGEPGPHNQLVTPQRVLLVDWESARRAPAERDLRTLVALGRPDLAEAAGADPDLLRLFDLEWRLDEIGQYAPRFAGTHAGGPDDETALAGLLEELYRP